MVDLEGLKKRIELVDVRLKTAHSARERESDALKQLWEQIHGRFDEQKGEIAELRKNVVVLEDVRDDLLGMVQTLLGTVENGLESITDETVPHIRQMAGDLLSGGEERIVAGPAFDNEPDRLNFVPSLDENREQDELLAAIERSLNNADDFPAIPGSGPSDPTTELQELAATTPNMDDDLADDTPGEISTAELSIKPLSPGIRNLVERLEGFSLPAHTPDQTEADTIDGDDLSRDLREIEVLRGELMGLRERVSGGR